MGMPSLIYEFESEQLSCTVSTESVAELTAWRIQQPEHTFIVHLSGQIDHLETEIDGRGSFYDPARSRSFRQGVIIKRSLTAESLVMRTLSCRPSKTQVPGVRHGT